MAALSFALRPGSIAPAPPSAAPPVSRPDLQLAAVYGEVDSLRAEVAVLRQHLAEPTPPASAPVHEAPEVQPDPAAAPQAVTPERAQAHFDELIEHEAVEPGWARAQEASISDFVKQEGGDGTLLESVQCRTSLCKLKLRFSGDQTRDAFKLKLGLPPLSEGGFYREEGETGLTYFAARKGHPLPAVPAP
jgi:hypothetical protein